VAKEAGMMVGTCFWVSGTLLLGDEMSSSSGIESMRRFKQVRGGEGHVIIEVDEKKSKKEIE
jgi:hypothetical protein